MPDAEFPQKTLSSATSVQGSGTIMPATITVAGATGITKTYDTTTALPTGALGLIRTAALGTGMMTVTAENASFAASNAGPRRSMSPA